MIEVRDAGTTFWSVGGLATSWSGASRPYFISSRREGMFLEQIARGAFADATAGHDSVDLRLEHREDGPKLASTASNTLRFSDQEKGLLLAAAVRKADPDAQLAVAKIRSGAYSGMSVGMVVREDTWGKASDGVTALRTITRANLAEVSIVHRPANPAAMVEVRKEMRSATGETVEYRSFFTEQRLGIRPGPDQVPEGGALCPECKGEGRSSGDGGVCIVCRGLGWADKGHLKLLKSGGGMVPDTATPAGRSAGINDLLIEFFQAQPGATKPLPALDSAAIRRQSMEIELEALALIGAGKSSNRGIPTTNRSPL
jgi:HK97 family phage prohead protease